MLSWSNKLQSLSGFERIKTIGRGAFGTAVLYRKKDDDSMVILKEINLHDLNVSERQLAQNEVRVLSMLDHPNIIGYYDSFEENGILIIEMEYADGGTLSQYLSQQDKPLTENNILEKFQQVVSAIKYIHQHNILHRDLKTDNIFLMQDGMIKLGDFGISKLMSLEQSSTTATVVGTPYYISPEMCEGKAYNNKSDIWALGCILYEMVCFQRTFDGSNLPALVNKIMKGQFAPVKENYSEPLKSLLMSLLQKEPEMRPSAEHIHDVILPQMTEECEKLKTEESSKHTSQHKDVQKSKSLQKLKSLLYYYDLKQSSLSMIPLPGKTMALSANHVIIVTSDWLVYSWGNNESGQLGHGDREARTNPCMIESLKGKSVIKACCGKDSSLFLSSNGIVMTCGNGSDGCLGHGDWSAVHNPKLIEALLSVDVKSLSCVSKHVVAVTSQGIVFSWGCGKFGCLGLGDESNHCKPCEVNLPHFIVDCFCGVDSSVLLTRDKNLLVCGNNQHNKLGLNQRQGFLVAVKKLFNKAETADTQHFNLVKSLSRYKVSRVCMGEHHSCVVTETGQILMAGANSKGQLGTGDVKPCSGFFEVPYFKSNPAISVTCGANFTVALTREELVMWGGKQEGGDGKNESRSSSAHSIKNAEVVDDSQKNEAEDDDLTDSVLMPTALMSSQLSLHGQLHSSWNSSSSDIDFCEKSQSSCCSSLTSSSRSSCCQSSNIVSVACQARNFHIIVEASLPQSNENDPKGARNSEQSPSIPQNFVIGVPDLHDLNSSELPAWLEKELTSNSEEVDAKHSQKSRKPNFVRNGKQFKPNTPVHKTSSLKKHRGQRKSKNITETSRTATEQKQKADEILKQEITNLRTELCEQNNELQKNYLLIEELQNKLKMMENKSLDAGQTDQNNQNCKEKSHICQIL